MQRQYAKLYFQEVHTKTLEYPGLAGLRTERGILLLLDGRIQGCLKYAAEKVVAAQESMEAQLRALETYTDTYANA